MRSNRAKARRLAKRLDSECTPVDVDAIERALNTVAADALTWARGQAIDAKRGCGRARAWSWLDEALAAEVKRLRGKHAH